MPHPLALPALALAAALALAPGSLAARRTVPLPRAMQAPPSWRLTHIGRDTVPLVVRGSDGRPLVTILGETLTLGPAERAHRVTAMRATVYDRVPCDLLRQLRAQGAGVGTGAGAGAGAGATRQAGDSAAPRASGDTTAAACEAMRVETDTVLGTVSGSGAARVVSWSASEPRLVVEERGDTLVLRPEGSPAGEVGGTLRYLRASR